MSFLPDQQNLMDNGNADDESKEASGFENDALLPDRCHSLKVIEAILFAAGYPVSYDKLASVLGTKISVVKKYISSYMEEYNSDDGLPRGIMLLMFEDSCQLCTKEQYGAYIREALGIKKGGNLSPSSIEVLAIIAYNEPVTRAFVDTVRGVDSSYVISSLADRHLIEVCGRLDVPGRPLLYRTTEDFLRVFGLNSLSELPAVSISSEKAPDSEQISFNCENPEKTGEE